MLAVVWVTFFLMYSPSLVPSSRVFGLESFGFSAPYKVLDEKLGYTAENVYNQAKSILLAE